MSDELTWEQQERIIDLAGGYHPSVGRHVKEKEFSVVREKYRKRIAEVVAECNKWETLYDEIADAIEFEVCRDNFGLTETHVEAVKRVVAERDALKRRVEDGIADGRAWVRDIIDERNRMKWLLTQVLNELPKSRDWLDPAIEKEIREITKS